MLNLCMHYALVNIKFAEVLPEKQEEYALITIMQYVINIRIVIIIQIFSIMSGRFSAVIND